jgi:hypothetical protein
VLLPALPDHPAATDELAAPHLDGTELSLRARWLAWPSLPEYIVWLVIGANAVMRSSSD